MQLIPLMPRSMESTFPRLWHHVPETACQCEEISEEISSSICLGACYQNLDRVLQANK